MPLPPILEVFVIWHPDDDRVGPKVADTIAGHFRSPTFSGLVGGAVEVYIRKDGWERPGGAPRPLPFTVSPPHGLPEAQFTALIPVLGARMARAVQDAGDWAAYVRSIVAARQYGIAVYPLHVPGVNLSGSDLEKIVGVAQALPEGSASEDDTLCRELSQAIAQGLDQSQKGPRRIKVFVSHTKHRSLEERDEDGPRLFDEVRRVCQTTRLEDFFDASDLQSGSDWEAELSAEAARSALLMVRTDRYGEREWTQREVLIAKVHDLPIVTLYALRAGENRGSFLMDHVPAIPCNLDDPKPGIISALNQVVNESLKRSLWRAQAVYLRDDGFDWLPVHAPEPVTIAPWLRRRRKEHPNPRKVRIIHPDPPLGLKERDAVIDLCALAGFDQDVQILTPRTFAARGGRIPA